MSRSVYEIECIALAVKLIVHLYGVALDGDSAFALQIHVVEHLCFHVLGGYGAGIFKQPVGKRGLAVVDVCYYAEISDILHLL